MTDTPISKLSSALQQVTLIAQKPKGLKEGQPIRYLDPVIKKIFACAALESLAHATQAGVPFVAIRPVDPVRTEPGGDIFAAFFTPAAYSLGSRKLPPLRMVNAKINPAVPLRHQLPIAMALSEICGTQVRIEQGEEYAAAFGRDLLITPQTDIAATVKEVEDSLAYIKEHGDLLKGPLAKQNEGRLVGSFFRGVELWGDRAPA